MHKNEDRNGREVLAQRRVRVEQCQVPIVDCDRHRQAENNKKDVLGLECTIAHSGNRWRA